MKKLSPLLAKTLMVGVCVLSLSACSDMTKTQQRTLSGAGIGAGVGAAGTAMTGGCVSCGAAVGAVVGAGTGYIYDQTQKKK
jgi:hypothetical protein